MKNVLKLLELAFFTACITVFHGCKKDAENPSVTMPSVTTAAVSQITITSAISGGVVSSNGNSNIITCGVCWSTFPNPTKANSITTQYITGSDKFTSTLNGLLPNTTYYVRAYITNTTGTAYGSEISFKSNPVAVELATLTTAPVSSITYAGAVSGGNITYDGGENLTEMGICWGTGANPTINDSKMSYGSGVASFLFLIGNLKPSTKYFVKAYATNSAGTSYGNELNFTTSSIGPIIFNPDLTYGAVSDIDGNIYKTIKIGTQIWMAENLKTTRFNDGSFIPNVTGETEWRNLTTPGYSWYNNDSTSYKVTFGALYNWNAISTNKLCPAGWHVPDDSEFSTLTSYLGNNSGDKITEKGNTHWLIVNTLAANDSGFTGLPGGMRRFYDSDTDPAVVFTGIGYEGMWWSASDKGASGDTFETYWDEDNQYHIHSTQFQMDKIDGMSVRCLKDN